jgi:hypothetical protein
LGSQRWPDIGEAAYRALLNGPVYRVYYLPRSMWVAGVEPV